MNRLYLNILFFILSLCMASYTQANPSILKEIHGKQISFESLKGKWVLINYWASWCQPCIDEIGEFNRFYKDNQDRVALFAVNFDMLPASEQMTLIKKYHISYPSLQEDPTGQLPTGNISGVPATFVFNPKGEFSQVLYGGQTLASLNKAISGKNLRK